MIQSYVLRCNRVQGIKDVKHLFVPYNGKIADITHADTNKHTLDLATALAEPRKIIGVFFGVERIAGTGFFGFYPNEGVQAKYLATGGTGALIIIADGTNRLQYALTVANDDFDGYCFGYVVEV